MTTPRTSRFTRPLRFLLAPVVAASLAPPASVEAASDRTTVTRRAEASAFEVGVALEKDAHYALPVCTGTNIRYTLRIENVGTVTGGAEIIDPIPEGATFVGGSESGGAGYDAFNDQVVWEGPLAPGESHAIGFSVLIDPGTDGSAVVNRATGTVSSGGIEAEVEVELPVDVDCPPLDFQVEKTAHFAEPLACPGGNVFYQIRITNQTQRNQVLKAELDDPVPAGATFAGSLSEGAAHDTVTDRVTWKGDLGPGDSATVGFSVTVDDTVDPGDSITNVATVTLPDPEGGEPLVKQAEVTVTCPEEPDENDLLVEVTKDSSPDDPLCPGSTIEYEVAITNPAANGRALEALILDFIPTGTAFAGGLKGGARHEITDDVVYWTGTLAPGQTQVIGFEVEVDADVAVGTVITNRAEGSLLDPETREPVVDEAEVQDTVGTCHGAEACPLQVIGFVEDGKGNHPGFADSRPYPISNSRVLLFDIEDDPLPIAPLSQQKYEPLGVPQRTNGTSETDFRDHEFPRPQRSGYEFDFDAVKASECPPRAAVVSTLWDADDRFAVAWLKPIQGRHVPAYLARCISDRPAEVLPAGPCYEWKRQGGVFVPWNPVTNQRAQVDFVYGSSPKNEDSIRVIFDRAAKTPLSESWDLPRGVTPDDFFEDASHIYFFSYKAVEFLSDLADDVRAELTENAKAHHEKPEELELSPVLITVTDDEHECRGACAGPRFESFGRLWAGGDTVFSNTIVLFNTAWSDPTSVDKPDNREWHELGHWWMIQLYDGKWPNGHSNDPGGCGLQAFLLPPDPPGWAGNRNHCGYVNETTTDSFIEGFAVFTSMVIADHYHDPEPFLYRFRGTSRSVEVDDQVWGPYRKLPPGGGVPAALLLLHPGDEDFAAAGILWDVHDKNTDPELKPKGFISKRIGTEDRAAHPAAEIFALLRAEHPDSLAGVHSTLSSSFPKDADGDGYDEIEEIFIAHGAFDDVTRDFVHDAGEFVGSTASGKLPIRPKRFAREPIPNGFLEVQVVADGTPASPDGFLLELRHEFEPPFDDYSFRQTVPGTGKLHLHMAAPVFPSRVEIVAKGTGAAADLQSSPFVVTSDDYWGAIESGAPSVARHTFVLGAEEPPDPPDGPWLASVELPGFEAKVRITPPSGEEVAGGAEPGCIVESLCVSGALAGRPEAFVKVIGPRPNGKLWTQISRFTPSAVEVWLRQVATDVTRYYRLDAVGPASDDVSGLQDREAFDPVGAAASVARGALLPGGAVEPLPGVGSRLRARLSARLEADPQPLEPGEPEPPAELDWLTTPELPGFRFKARTHPAGAESVGGQRVELCIPETLCIHGALAGRPEVFAKIIGPRPNGFLWVQAARFTPSEVELWVEQIGTGTVRYYRLAPVGAGVDDVSGLQHREAFLP